MIRPDPDAYAALICDWCLEVAPGQCVVVSSTTLAEEYGLALHVAILERDAWPLVWLTPPSLSRAVYRHGRQRHWSEPSPLELALLEAADARVAIDARSDSFRLALGRIFTERREAISIGTI